MPEVTRDVVEIGAHQRVVARIVEQERVVPVRRVDFRIADVGAVVEQRFHDFARALRREAPVRGERSDEKARLCRRERARQVVAAGRGRVEIVQRARDQQIGVGVEVFGELVALMAQIGLDLEIDVEMEIDRARAQAAAEFFHHRVIRQVSDVADHAREAQAAARHHVVAVEIAAMEIRIGGDRLARDLVESDVLRRQLGRRGDDDGVGDALRIGDRPLQRLHRAEAAAHHRGEALDAEAVGQARLRIDPVLDRDHGEAGAVGLAGLRIDRSRAGGAEAAAGVVHADDEEAVGVQRLARADHVVPPADVLRLGRIVAGDVVRSVERVAHQHRIRLGRVQRAVGFVHQVVGVQHRAAPACERRIEVHGLRPDCAY